jgi:hypothetical protein
MRTVTLIPSHVGVAAGRWGDREVGILTLAGSGSNSHLLLEVVLDPAMMGQLEAAVSEARLELRRAKAA